MIFTVEMTVSLDADSEEHAEIAADRIAAHVTQLFGPHGAAWHGIDAVVARAAVEVVVPKGRPAA
jgi:hypothetical protein